MSCQPVDRTGLYFMVFACLMYSCGTHSRVKSLEEKIDKIKLELPAPPLEVSK